MKFRNPFKDQSTVIAKSASLDPDQMPEPKDLEGYLRRGWAYHSRSLNEKAEVDFRRALAFDADSVDTNYALGLVLKAQGRKEDAIAVFKKTVDLIDSGKVENKAKREMLHRLALGHVNELSVGDWNLEKEIWQHIS